MIITGLFAAILCALMFARGDRAPSSDDGVALDPDPK